jgi:hypothetical protein
MCVVCERSDIGKKYMFVQRTEGRLVASAYGGREMMCELVQRPNCVLSWCLIGQLIGKEFTFYSSCLGKLLCLSLENDLE